MGNSYPFIVGQKLGCLRIALPQMEETGVTTRTSLEGVNEFTFRARQNGYRTKYLGPRGII